MSKTEQLREAFDFGYAMALDYIHNETLYYLADTKRKTVEWEWLRKRIPGQEFGESQKDYLEKIESIRTKSNQTNKGE